MRLNGGVGYIVEGGGDQAVWSAVVHGVGMAVDESRWRQWDCGGIQLVDKMFSDVVLGGHWGCVIVCGRKWWV